MFLHFGLLVLGCTASVTAAEEISNMNKGGEYLIANDKEGTAVKFNTSYASKKDAEYFDVYAGPVSTRYGEVFWQVRVRVTLITHTFIRRCRILSKTIMKL